jgi:hypothetical protein
MTTPLTTHITDSNHNWIVPTCDEGGTDLADCYVGSGILNYPTGYAGSNFIQANWTPITDSWYIEVDVKVLAGSAGTPAITFAMKTNSDINFYGPEAKIYTDSVDGWINFNSYDASGHNINDGINFFDNVPQTFRMEFIDGSRVRGFLYDGTDRYDELNPFYNTYNSQPILEFSQSVIRPLIQFNTGNDNTYIKVDRFLANDFIPDLNICADVGTNYYPTLQDEFEGSGYISSHLPDIDDTGSNDFYYVSSANATLSGSSVSPAIFQLLTLAANTSFYCFFVKVHLKEFEKITFIIEVSDGNYTLDLRWAVETSCKIERNDSNGTDTQTFSIGSYEISDELVAFINFSTNAVDVYIAPDLTTPIATLNASLTNIYSSDQLLGMRVSCTFGTSSSVDYFRFCGYSGV